jgi:hypothetical protein
LRAHAIRLAALPRISSGLRAVPADHALSAVISTIRTTSAMMRFNS